MGYQMKAALYTRVSTEEQSKEGVSLSNQLDKCRLQAQLSELSIVREIQDGGKSGKSLSRPGIEEIIRLAKRKEIDAVVIYKLDRLTRNVSDLNRLIELFTKCGVSLISVKDSLDTQTAAGRMVINILGTISQWEREAIGERTKEALDYKKSENRKFTSLDPYGFKLQGESYFEVLEEQETIREITRLREEAKLSYQGIADYLNGIGIPTRKGNPWLKKTVANIYTGTKAGNRMVTK